MNIYYVIAGWCSAALAIAAGVWWFRTGEWVLLALCLGFLVAAGMLFYGVILDEEQEEDVPEGPPPLEKFAADLTSPVSGIGMVEYPNYATDLVNAVVPAYMNFYDANKHALDYGLFVRECTASFKGMVNAIPPAGKGPLETHMSSDDYKVEQRIMDALNGPFKGSLRDYIISLNTNSYADRPIHFENETYEEYQQAYKKFEKLQDNFIDMLGPAKMALDIKFEFSLFRPAMLAILNAMGGMMVDYQFPDALRFRGHWIVGKHGTGKTTYLSGLINYDLKQVAKGEASVVVIDSQNELIPQLAALKVFADDGPLAGRLIYLEADPEHPLALNIFDTQSERFNTMNAGDRETIMRGAMQMVQFFLSSILQSDTTPHMDTVLAHVVPAVLSIQDATIFTLQELLETTGYVKLKDRLNIDPEEHFWLSQRLYSPEFKQTLGALKARLDGFTADPMFRRMFRQPRNRLDLFTELQSSKVILINTNKGLLKGATEPFGRFFIAKLLQATEERMLLDKGSRLPVFCYVDEAADYISREENITELVNKARKQLVALTFAAQSEEDIRSATVLAALRRMALQSTLQTPGGARATIDGEEKLLSVPATDLTRLPTMSKDQFAKIKEQMWDRYTVKTSVPKLVQMEPSPPPDLSDDEIKPS